MLVSAHHKARTIAYKKGITRWWSATRHSRRTAVPCTQKMLMPMRFQWPKYYVMWSIPRKLGCPGVPGTCRCACPGACPVSFMHWCRYFIAELGVPLNSQLTAINSSASPAVMSISYHLSCSCITATPQRFSASSHGLRSITPARSPFIIPRRSCNVTRSESRGPTFVLESQICCALTQAGCAVLVCRECKLRHSCP